MWGKRPRPPEPTKHQLNVKALAALHLIKHGCIDALTIQRMGTTAPHRLINRLRKDGYLRPLDHPRAFTTAPNRSGHGSYRIHYWSGWKPKAGDRRATKRGGAK
jgi:hypothetical protein